MRSVELKILYLTDELLQLKKAGIESPLDECEIRWVTFYNIDAVADYFDEEKSYSEIFSGGTSFICIETKETVNRLIENARR